jgi:hypothetical protein
MVRFAGAEPVLFAAVTAGCDSFLALVHLAFCACAIFRREAADVIRVGQPAEHEEQNRRGDPECQNPFAAVSPEQQTSKAKPAAMTPTHGIRTYLTEN